MTFSVAGGDVEGRLAVTAAGGCGGGAGQKLVGDLAHGRDHHDGLQGSCKAAGDDAGGALDSGSVLYGGSAKLHDNDFLVGRAHASAITVSAGSSCR